MANHRKYAITFTALNNSDLADSGGFTYNRTQKHGTTALKGTGNLPFAVSLVESGTHAGKARFAGDGEALMGVPENLESDYNLTVMISGVAELPIGNDASGVAYTVAIGEPVVGAVGSSQLSHSTAANMRAGAVSSSTQRRGHVRGADRVVADAAGNSAGQINTMVADVENSLEEIAKGARAICIGTRTAAASETFNGTAIVLFL